jgi:hypothetical protein
MIDDVLPDRQARVHREHGIEHLRAVGDQLLVNHSELDLFCNQRFAGEALLR